MSEEAITLTEINRQLNFIQDKLDKGYQYLYDGYFIKSYLELKALRDDLSYLSHRIYRTCVITDEQSKEADRIRRFVKDCREVDND
jgi:hypothetical protein